MYKNTAGQFLYVYVTDLAGQPLTGEDTNLAAGGASVALDYAAAAPITSTTFVEVDPALMPGYYAVDLTQAETDGNRGLFGCTSSNAASIVTCVPPVVNFLPPNFTEDTYTQALTAVTVLAQISARLFATGGAVASSTSTTVTTTTALGTSSKFKGMRVVFWDGVAVLQDRIITDYNNSTKVMTVDRPFITNPGAGNNFTICYDSKSPLDANLKIQAVALVDLVTSVTGLAAALAAIQADTDDVQTRLPAALTAGGNMKSDIFGFLGTVFTEGAAGRIAAAFKQFFNIASPAATMDHGILVDTVTTVTGLAAALAALQADTDDIQTRLPSSLTGDGNIKADALKLNGATPNNLSAAQVLTALWPGVTKVTGAVVADGGNTASTFKTNLTETATDHWKDAFITFTSGALSGQTKKISAFNGTSKFLTTAAFSAAPAAGVTFILVNV